MIGARINFKEHVGDRLLYGEGPYQEAVIEEVSPSGDYIKMSGVWLYHSQVFVLEWLSNERSAK